MYGTLADEIRSVHAQIRESFAPAEEDVDWAATAERIQEDLSRLVEQYEAARRWEDPVPVETPADPGKVARLTTILKLMAAEL
jgi:hypothetical protein